MIDPAQLRTLVPRALSVLVRRGADFATAEDAVQEALVRALDAWRDVPPADPQGWLVTVAWRAHLDMVRSAVARRAREERVDAEPPPGDAPSIDDTLRLHFLCAHPDLSPSSAVALTLRAVGGLTTRQIAQAYLVPEATMAQRISRAKRTVAAAGLDRPGVGGVDDIRTVMRVLYLVFNAGYSGEVDLAAEAIRLARQLGDLTDHDPEVAGLLALMLLHHARRDSRTGIDGRIVPLAEQDRTRWDHALMAEGIDILQAALATDRLGEYQAQAAIAALHADAPTFAETDWVQIVEWYDELLRFADTPVVRLNRAVAVGEADGAPAGLAALATIDPATPRYDAVAAHLHEANGELEIAARRYTIAAHHATDVAERDHLTRQAARLNQRLHDGRRRGAYRASVTSDPAPNPFDPAPNPFRRTTLEVLRQRTSAKWRKYEPDVLPLWVAEMDVDLPDAVVRAVCSTVEHGDTGYPSGTGYAAALSSFARERWGWDDLAVERTTNVADVMRGIDEVLDVLSTRDDAVVVNCPVYPPFYDHVRHSGRRLIEAPLDAMGRIDFEVLERAFAAAAAHGAHPAYLLCSPHNPTGTVHTEEELTAVAALAHTHGVRVLVDEIHAPLVLPGATFVPYLAVPGGERGFSIMSASKAWNLAGIKAAVVVAGPDATADLARIPTWAAFGASHLGIIAHTAALREGGPWLDVLLGALDTNRRLLGDLLAEHLSAVGYRPPQGTYLTWLDCRALGLGDDPAVRFLADGRVAVNPGPTFGTGGAGHVRLNIATSPEILTEAVQRMASVVGR